MTLFQKISLCLVMAVCLSGSVPAGVSTLWHSPHPGDLRVMDVCEMGKRVYALLRADVHHPVLVRLDQGVEEFRLAEHLSEFGLTFISSATLMPLSNGNLMIALEGKRDVRADEAPLLLVLEFDPETEMFTVPCDLSSDGRGFMYPALFNGEGDKPRLMVVRTPISEDPRSVAFFDLKDGPTLHGEVTLPSMDGFPIMRSMAGVSGALMMETILPFDGTNTSHALVHWLSTDSEQVGELDFSTVSPMDRRNLPPMPLTAWEIPGHEAWGIVALENRSLEASAEVQSGNELALSLWRLDREGLRCEGDMMRYQGMNNVLSPMAWPVAPDQVLVSHCHGDYLHDPPTIMEDGSELLTAWNEAVFHLLTYDETGQLIERATATVPEEDLPESNFIPATEMMHPIHRNGEIEMLYGFENDLLLIPLEWESDSTP